VVQNRAVLLPAVDYARPKTVEEAVRLLAAHDGARPLAGGQTLLNVMKARAAAPDVLVDLADLEDLRAIRSDGDGSLQLGAMATYADVMLSPDVSERRAILAEVAHAIADVQVRNRGTVGGNVCANDPTNHYPPLLAALAASFEIVGAGGARTVSADEFFVGVFDTAVRPGELLTRITVPPVNGAGDGFASLSIGKDGTGIVNAAATVAGGAARVAIGCVAAVPVVVEAAADETSVRDAVRGAGLDPPSDVHASGDYRRHLAEVLAVRAVRRAREGR
jgi:carbon-monoxide dehydrogenase medium subunit